MQYLFAQTGEFGKQYLCGADMKLWTHETKLQGKGRGHSPLMPERQLAKHGRPLPWNLKLQKIL